MDDKTKELIRNHLHLLRERDIWCVHNRVSICVKCNANISGNLTNVRGDLTGICGDLTGICGDLTGIRATADEIKEVLREKEWEKEL